MRLVVVTREERDYAREVREWLHEFEARAVMSAEVVDPDSRDGVGFIGAYDLMNFPAVLVLTDDGRVLHSWQGTPMPPIDEVRGYLAA
jgi:hypothetical protein